MADKRRRMSAVWKHFIATATNENKASSSICDCVFPTGGSSVKGYTTHSENNYLSFTITYIQLITHLSQLCFVHCHNFTHSKYDK